MEELKKEIAEIKEYLEIVSGEELSFEELLQKYRNWEKEMLSDTAISNKF